MLRTVSLFLIAGTLSACSAMTHPLPKCDGYSRRPLNRSLWQWEDDSKLKQPASKASPADPASHAASYAQEPASATPAAFARFDVEGSDRPCKGK
jgi:type IV secretion system protein VirB7